ncbi:hypothetical protein N7495_006772 [Penicillium taxi]|uniref:uncharacterized protein n=1 Tax=Penicillium taxi TaxID=168475 RepID=UPI0025452318|nr:uncharacterized protein N7495_006772 [Penicillium taxi]KAJ5895081.1 hypothetical protein N7495_006772 [Penicillium taxi]
MQYKLLSTLLFIAPALASPVATETESADSLDIDLGVPSSILAVLETAIPESFFTQIEDPAYQSSLESDLAAGTYPAWYNSLPESVKAWATSYDSDLFGSDVTTTADNTAASTAAATATATGAASSSAVATGTADSTAAASSDAATTGTTTGATTSGETATKSTASSSTSTGGAPAATAGVAMSFAGAAGLLGFALAL